MPIIFSRIVFFGLFLGVAPLASLEAGSEGGSSQGLLQLADKEIVRRQENLIRSRRLSQEAREALRNKEYEISYVKYLDAVELMPSGEEVLAKERTTLVNQFSDAAVKYAEFLITQGRYSDAEQVAKTVLLPRFNPTYRPAVQLIANLEQPDYYNKTVTPQFAQKRDDVTRLLQEAEGFYSSGRFDLADRRYNQVLEIDPYNSAARKGMERVDGQRLSYYNEAYNQTRSQMMWEVSKAWETPVRRTNRQEFETGLVQEASGTEAINAKLNRIILPRISFDDDPLQEVINSLMEQSRRLDQTPDEAKRGVNILLSLDRTGRAGEEEVAGSSPSPDTRITLNLNYVPLYEALRYVAELAGLRLKIEQFAVMLVPLSEPIDSLITKEYRVPAGFIPPARAPSTNQGFQARGFGNQGARGPEPVIQNRVNAQQFLEEIGVTFPPGASASYIPTGSKLVVKNTLDNIELIDNLVDSTFGVAPTQVQIQSKFLEISQNNLSELGFDWLLGPVAIGGSDPVYLSGGDTRVNANNYPFGTDGMYSMTNGLRSGTGFGSAVSSNTIESFLAGNTAGAVAPGIFGVAGIFSDVQFQAVIRALDQKKGVDLLSAPQVTTKSGQSATVRIVRKFFYPTQFDPPVIPTETGSGGAAGGGATAVIRNPLLRQPPTITPSFPSGFESRDIGVILEVTPVVGNDTYTIDLNLNPEVVEFDGFINYGADIATVGYVPASPSEIVDSILSTGSNAAQPIGFLVPVPQILTQNVINQPIFSVRKVTTNVTIWDGQTVALGGLMREDVQNIEDKVPILGDVPLAGRLFRSNVDQKIKRNLVVFVTANIIDAEGQPLRRDTFEEEFVEPLGLPGPLAGPEFPSMKGGGYISK